RIVNRAPWFDGKPQARKLFQLRACPEIFVTFPILVRRGPAAAERRSEVEHVVSDGGLAAVHDERVERVASLCVYAIDPRRSHAHAAELTTILVRHDVVGVVRARPIVEEFTNGFALEGVVP